MMFCLKKKKSNELERFRKSVKDARRLSDFAISEGADVDDETIEVINHAAEFLDNDNPPELHQRVAFEKAYRDLVKAIHPVTLESLRASEFLPGWFKLLAFVVIFFGSGGYQLDPRNRLGRD
jgi:hypothetical protein